MEKAYIISIDQSTQGTKAMLINEHGQAVAWKEIQHRQIVNENGWVEHDAEEIARNVISVVSSLLSNSKADRRKIVGVGIANQRESVVAWDRTTGKPVCNSIVWQCNRASAICERINEQGYAQTIQNTTGLRLSPFFSASKITWILENVPGAKEKARQGELCIGTMDSWVIYTLTGGKVHKTDCSNASRTQLMNLQTLSWDKTVCGIFGVPISALPEICDTDALFGFTDFSGVLDTPVPIHAAVGDSHAVLFAQGCVQKGMCMTGYGTGSCVMMNIGDHPIPSRNGLLTSVAWKTKEGVAYAFDGVINYSGAIITWLIQDLKLIKSPDESESLAKSANSADNSFLVPAFTGIGSPYWCDSAHAVLCGMCRTTGKAELVKASLESIAYQVADVVFAMCMDAGTSLSELRVAGGPTNNDYLMQFQSDILNCPIHIPCNRQMTCLGAGYIAGIALQMFEISAITQKNTYKVFQPFMSETIRKDKLNGWKNAVKSTLIYSGAKYD